METLDVLSKLGIFQGIPMDGLSQLADQGMLRSFPAGMQLMSQGAMSESMHVILQGSVRVERSHSDLSEPVILADEMGPGEVIGEMGVLDDEPRSAAVIAVTNTETLELGAGLLATVLLQYPDVAIALLQLLSRRLRTTDELLVQIERRSHREESR